MLLINISYQVLCRHYRLKATHNNPGFSHENGAIEASHGHLKRRLIAIPPIAIRCRQSEPLLFYGANLPLFYLLLCDP